ncbi:MAG: 1-deoxy-D-xylulose-5-phosphate synthase, partial [Cellulomonadaceae bacterium]|nr:1-deoxy-D-xylulose-5-phosphate synthase [Cellulomonadaceae bacterium]
RSRWVVTVEEHYDRGGLGGAVCGLLAPYGLRVDQIAVPHAYVPSGSHAEVLAAVGLDATGIARQLFALWARRAV